MDQSTKSTHLLKAFMSLAIRCYLWFPCELRETCYEHLQMAFYHLRNIARIRNCLSQDNAETLVHAFVSSKLDFCNALLYGLPKSVIDKLQYVQNCAARLVTRTWSSEHITPFLRRLHWLPVKQRITYKILLLTYKALNGMAPRYIADLLQPHTPTRQLRSFSKNLLVIPKSNLKFYRDIFSSCCAQALKLPTRWH